MAAGLAALVLGGCAAPPLQVAPAPAPAPAAKPASPLAEISGKWRMVRSTVKFADGTSRGNATTTPCFLEIKPDLVTSTCQMDGKEARIVTRVSCPEGIRGERACDTVIVENVLLPQHVGRRSKVAYRMDGGELTVFAYPRSGSPGDDKLPESVISVLVRD